LAALLHGTPAVGVKLCGVDQRAPPIFGRAAITLGIGPHSSLIELFPDVDEVVRVVQQSFKKRFTSLNKIKTGDSEF